MQKQVDKKAYNFHKYCGLGRWISYWYQINEILKIGPRSILEIGGGDKFLENYLKNNTDIEYKNLDIAEDLNPDILGSVDSMPLPDNSFDMVCAFEILEHLPFEKLEKSLKEIYRVSRGDVIISLPHWGRHFSISVRLPYFRIIRFMYKLNLFSQKHRFNGQHYWEIGKSGYSLKIIIKKIQDCGFLIKKDFVVFEMPYHHFFILKK